MKKCIALLFFVVCVTSSSALRCYSCTFPGSAKCENPDSSVVQDCSEPGFVEKAAGVKPICLKTSVKANDVEAITRSCSLQGGAIDACKLATMAGAKSEHCSICETDLCNGSSRMKFGLLTLLPIAVFFSVKFF